MRIVVARCAVIYSGRLPSTSLAPAVRTLLVKADGSLLIHADAGTKALNWMPGGKHTHLRESVDAGGVRTWTVTNKAGETLTVTLLEVLADSEHVLGAEPGLVKDGVEAELQTLLAADPAVLGPGLTLIRREHPTAVGPVDLLLRHPDGGTVAVEVKRVVDSIDPCEQLRRYVSLMSKDPLLGPVRGMLVATRVVPQARVQAAEYGFSVTVVNLEALRDDAPDDSRLF
jgi:hypothetical protein